jgi:hypothetical protein
MGVILKPNDCMASSGGRSERRNWQIVLCARFAYWRAALPLLKKSIIEFRSVKAAPMTPATL